jgi:hypothetical protein
MDPLYNCDFCLKLFTENELERCHTCGEIFCFKCVKKASFLILDEVKGVLMNFCTETCLNEHLCDGAAKDIANTY